MITLAALPRVQPPRRFAGGCRQRCWPLARWASPSYLALHNYQVDIDVYRMGGQHVLSPNLYSVQFGNSGLEFTYPPFAALLFAVFGLNLGIWPLQAVCAGVNVVALVAFIYLSIRIVVPKLERQQRAWWALLLLGPAIALNPVFNTIGLGQINLVLAILLLGIWRPKPRSARAPCRSGWRLGWQRP